MMLKALILWHQSDRRRRRRLHLSVGRVDESSFLTVLWSARKALDGNNQDGCIGVGNSQHQNGVDWWLDSATIDADRDPQHPIMVIINTTAGLSTLSTTD